MNNIKLSEIMQHIISHACNADHRSNGHITIEQALAMYNIITTTDKEELQMKKVHIHSAYAGAAIEVDAVEISAAEWDKMKYKKQTPSTVFVTETGRGYYNSFTCESDTCNHVSHPRKRWIEFDPQTGEYTDDIKLW